MPIGPLESFVFPGVFTTTTNEPPLATAAGNIRFPAYIGVGVEQLRVSNFEMVRGSSATADNIIIGEDVSSQFTGTNRQFTVANFPIVTGNGKGVVATLPTQVIVQVNNNQTAVSAVSGLTGVVTLVTPPNAGDQVLVNYFYKKTDTYIENENLTDQATGSALTFKVNSDRIVKGDNGGVLAVTSDISSTAQILVDGTLTTVPVISVTVNGSPATVTALSGADATFTLSSAPALSATVLVTYFTNTLQHTFDILPAGTVLDIVKVGLGSDTTDFASNNDYLLTSPNHINWGNAAAVSAGVVTVDSQPFDSTIISETLVDNRSFKLKASGTVNSSNKQFTLPTLPVKGDGLGIPLEDPTNGSTPTYDDVLAYVGTSPATASPVQVISIRGSVITLATAPTSGNNVYVSFFQNFLTDDKWTFTNTVAGGVGVGTYSVVGSFSGPAKTIAVVSGSSTVTYPEATYSGSGPGTGGVNARIVPSKIIGNELVTVTFLAGAFTVTSNLATGTGSDVTSNTGVVGQTYVDTISGFRVTFASATDGTIQFNITRVHTASASFQLSIPGLRFLVTSTTGIEVSDTGVMTTFTRTGNEPDVGDTYYVTFDQVKTEYSVQFLTNMSDVTRLFGPLAINNKIVLAANLAFQNGAQAVALQQIKQDATTGDGTVQDYLTAIASFDNPLVNGLRPSLLEVLTTNTTVINALASSNATQSSIRYRNERTSYFGFALGTSPALASQIASGIQNEKMNAVYPDGATITLTDEFGNSVDYLVGGEVVAAAMAGRDVSPITDIATPLTNGKLVGFNHLFRRLDNVTAAQVAQSGVTVLEERNGAVRIRMALTTDLSSALTRDPRIVEVKHFIQQGVRAALDPYVGAKFLPSVLSAIETTLGSYFKSLKKAALIVDFKGISAKVDASDPSTADVEVFYSPVFPLNWIVVTLNLRSTLS